MIDLTRPRLATYTLDLSMNAHWESVTANQAAKRAQGERA